MIHPDAWGFSCHVSILGWVRTLEHETTHDYAVLSAPQSHVSIPKLSLNSLIMKHGQFLMKHGCPKQQAEQGVETVPKTAFAGAKLIRPV